MVHLEQKEEWFATWFNSPYYHILYEDRDDSEAHLFLERLKSHLQLPPKATVLDLACGAGRHARVLLELGFTVSGADLSANSIEQAKSDVDSAQIDFFVHDMRMPLPKQFHAVFNLFTSFGYFDSILENEKVLQSVYQSLHTNGLLIIDFMNTEKVIQELKPRQEITRKGVVFHIKKEVANGRIVKSIAFEAEGKSYFFQEKVQALTRTDFQQLLQKTGFEIEHTFGTYELTDYDSVNSDRLILICRKPA